ncbi:MAG: hypothetical protein GY940_23620 [bacterium]|nr:hypothetical protein [bacterium]
MFQKVFKKFHEKNNGIMVIGVWGKDGLELDKAFFSEVVDVDLEFSGAELADIITKLDKTKIAPENFFLKLKFYNYYLRIFSLTPDYFLMVLSRNGDVIDAKLQFYLKLYHNELISFL